MTSDTLLYDFNLNIGDTLPPTYLMNGLNQQPSIVTGFDSVLVNGKYNKRFIFNNNTTQGWNVNTLVEGVGSGGSLDLIYDVFEGGPSTACFNGNVITGEAFLSECSTNGFTVAIIENSDNNNLEIYPNPFSSQATLQTATSFKNASLTVYNSVGQTVKHVDNLAGQTVIFHRDNLPSGLYLVRLTQDGNTISADKFVIVD